MIEELAISVQNGFTEVKNEMKEGFADIRKEMKDGFSEVNERLDSIECTLTNHGNRLDRHEDAILVIKSKVGIR